jgi:hypothetical protein
MKPYFMLLALLGGILWLSPVAWSVTTHSNGWLRISGSCRNA